MTMTTRKWEDLETDCLAKVFEKIDLSSLIFVVLSVCKSWYRTSLLPNCWKVLDFRKLEEELFYPYEEELFYNDKRITFTEIIKYGVDHSCGAAVKVVLPKRATIEDLDYISDRCPGSKILDVELGYGNSEHISEIIGKFEYLEVLYWGPLDVNCLLKLLDGCKELKYLYVRGGCCFLTDEYKDILMKAASRIKIVFCSRNSSWPEKNQRDCCLGGRIYTLASPSLTTFWKMCLKRKGKSVKSPPPGSNLAGFLGQEELR